jgi:hypothetical protein
MLFFMKLAPQKFVFLTRHNQTHFHIALAKRLLGEFPEARVLFASFFSRSIDLAQKAGFETLYFPDALRAAGDHRLSEERLAEVDRFCRREYMSLGAVLQTERFLPPSREGVERFFHQHLLVLDRIIEPHTVTVSTMYDHFVYLAAGMLAMEKGGAPFAFVGCGVPAGRVIGLRTPWEAWRNAGSREDAAALWEVARQEVITPPETRIEYMKSLAGKRPTLPLARRLRAAWKMRQCSLRDHQAGSYFPVSYRHWPFTALAWRWRTRRGRRQTGIWDIESADQLAALASPCVFLALHMEPEATILMYSPRFRDQLEICRLVSEALPVGTLLLVKENPKMLGRRPKGYYEQIKRLPNVRLVSLSVPSPALVAKSVAVVSLAGTITVEAKLSGKRAFCFGRPPFYRFADGLGASLLEKLAEPGSETGSGEPAPRLLKAWKRWVQSTFAGKAMQTEFDPSTGTWIYDPSEENVRGYFEFITGCLRSSQCGEEEG